MSEISPPTMPRKGHPFVAWLVIFAAVAFLLWRQSADDPTQRQRYDLLMTRFIGRIMVGLDELQKQSSSGKRDPAHLCEQAAQSMDKHSYAQRLRFVVMAGELLGPGEARDRLRQLNQAWHDHDLTPSAEDAATAQLLDRLYAAQLKDAPAAKSLSTEDQNELRQRLGWFGDLALTPAEGSDAAMRAAVLAPAWRTMWMFLALIGVMGGFFVAGVILLMVLLLLWCLRLLRGGLKVGSSYGGIYAETFALYLVLFLGLSYCASLPQWTQGRLLLIGLAALGSLAALIWPMLRGVPWRQVRDDIGWRMGRRPWLEPVLGVGGYALAWLMAIGGGIVAFSLTRLRDRLGFGPDPFGPSDAPSHPILFRVANGGWQVWLQILFLVVVVAPVVEETMFRGVLYRQLREASAGWRPAVSVLFSALGVSFIFAVIHPYNLLFVPVLMGLALAFTVMREWRQTLIPCMIAHGCNNGVASVMLFVLTS